MPTERTAAGPLELTLSDGVTGADWSWSQRDEAMARRILATSPPSARTLAAAGNARTPTRPAELGVPMGARLAGQRPGTREVPISYGGGSSCNGEPGQFARRTERPGQIRLHSTKASSYWTFPQPPRRSCRSDRTHDPTAQAQVTFIEAEADDRLPYGDV